MMRVAYVHKLFKFAIKFDPRLERRLVMSQSMSGAAHKLGITLLVLNRAPTPSGP